MLYNFDFTVETVSVSGKRIQIPAIAEVNKESSDSLQGYIYVAKGEKKVKAGDFLWNARYAFPSIRLLRKGADGNVQSVIERANRRGATFTVASLQQGWLCWKKSQSQQVQEPASPVPEEPQPAIE